MKKKTPTVASTLNQKHKSKPWTQMTTAELREATKEFDKPTPLSATRLLSKAERARFERSRRHGVTHSLLPDRVSASLLDDIDPQIISRIQTYAVNHQMKFSEFVAKSLQSSLTFVGA